MTYRMLLILAVLIALPFNIVRADDPILNSIKNSNWILADWEPLTKPDDALLDTTCTRITISTPTFVVYFIDTVGWEVIQQDSIPADCDRGVDPPQHIWSACYTVRVKYGPKIDTIIVARFTTDAETKQIRKWRVMEAK